MKTLVKLFAGLWMTSLMLMIVIYLFSDTAEETVTGATFEDLALASIKLTLRQNRLYDPQQKDKAKRIADQIASQGVDVSTPIYKLLKKNDAITDLSVRSAILADDGRRVASRTVISFNHDGLKYVASFLASDKTFLSMQSSEFQGSDGVKVYSPGSSSPFLVDDPTVLFAALAPHSKVRLTQVLPPALINQQTSVQKTLPPARPKVTADDIASAKTLAANIRNGQIRQDVTSVLPLRRTPDAGVGGLFQTQRGQAWLVLNTVTGPNAYTCDIDGPAVISGNQLTVQDDTCQLILTMDANGVAKVVTDSCQSQCGLGGTLDGVYAIGEKVAMP